MLGRPDIPCTSCLQLNDKLIDGRAIPYEYERLCSASVESNRSTAYSMSSLEIMKRNRYTDVLPFDESRVLLEGLDCDYINASVLTSRWGLGMVVAKYSVFPLPCSSWVQVMHSITVEVCAGSALNWCKVHTAVQLDTCVSSAGRRSTAA